MFEACPGSGARFFLVALWEISCKMLDRKI